LAPAATLDELRETGAKLRKHAPPSHPSGALVSTLLARAPLTLLPADAAAHLLTQLASNAWTVARRRDAWALLELLARWFAQTLASTPASFAALAALLDAPKPEVRARALALLAPLTLHAPATLAGSAVADELRRALLATALQSESVEATRNATLAALRLGAARGDDDAAAGGAALAGKLARQLETTQDARLLAALAGMTALARGALVVCRFLRVLYVPTWSLCCRCTNSFR
jgi:hypothetical protein